MNQQIKFSIIIPVYNVEQYLSRCIESVLSQSYNNFEIILVNDGSTDTSGSICDQYNEKDSRITVIHKNNEGVSIARNTGLNACLGSYITFLDSDDYICEDTLMAVFQLVANKDVDIIEIPCTYNAGNSSLEKINKTKITLCYNKKKDIYNYWFYNPRYEACGRFYNHKLVQNILFDHRLNVGEDVKFVLQCMNLCHSYVISTNGMYYYCYRKESVMNSLTAKDILSYDNILLTNLFSTDILLGNLQLLLNLLYRSVAPKFVDPFFYNKEPYSFYYLKSVLSKISIFQIIFSQSPFKVKLFILSLKLLGIRKVLNFSKLIK